MNSLALLLLASATVCAQVAAMSTEHGGSKATVMIIDGSATLRLESPAGAPRTIALGSDWKRVTGVRFSPNAARIAIVIEAAAPLLFVVDAATSRVTATYPVTAVAIAPDGRAVIFERPRAQSDDHAGFTFLALNGSTDPAPEQSDILNALARGRFSRQSEFQWTDPEVVAFIVRAGSEASVVAFQADQSGRIEKQGMQPLRADDLVNASQLAPGVTAAQAFAGAAITRLPGSGLTVRLQLPANPALRLGTVDLRIWD